MKGHWKKQFNYEYLGSYSLDGNREVIATISKLSQEKVKGMILNRTNARAIEKVSGSGLIEDWLGVQVSLYVEKGVRAFGEVVDALRIRNRKPNRQTMTKEIELSMLDAIKQGKSAQVEQALIRYNMSDKQRESINLELSK